MTQPIKTTNSSVSPGDIQFLSAIHPPLTSGNYTLAGTQEIKNLDQGDVDPYTASQDFFITAPQFTLDPSMIHSVYPPKGQTGNYFNQMPFIVFNNFALPWARTLEPGQAQTDNSPPWMAIILAYESDMAGDTPSVGSVNAITGKWVGPVTIPAENVITVESNVIIPALSSDDISNGPDTKAQVIDMNYQFFLDIAPTLEEMPLLTHARDVNTDGKVMLGMDADGLFSVVVSNRVPPKDGGKCTAFLVSLEGHQNHLPSPVTHAEGDQSIRLVVLGGWDFVASEEPGSFRQLMININEKADGIGLLHAPEDTSEIENKEVIKALDIGYVALQNDLRIGEQSTSWYRGPCVPAPTKQVTDYAPYHYSDHAIQYDPETGIFDLSYAAAWQVGRLLALSDGSFSQSLYSWRRSYLESVQSNAEQSSVEGMVASALNIDNSTTTTSSKVVPQLHQFMQTIATAKDPVFPKVNIRSPLTSSTRPHDDLTSQANSSDPLVSMVSQHNEKGS